TDATIQDLTGQVSWTSSDPSVASISSGQLHAVNIGNTTIGAALGGVSGSSTIHVTGASLLSIEIAPASYAFAKGFDQQFTALGHYTDASQVDLTAQATWSSSNLAIATISAQGLAHAVGTGSATITATQGAIQTSTTLDVTDAVLMSLQISPTTPSL